MLDAGLVGSRCRQVRWLVCVQQEDIVRRDIRTGGVLAVERHPGNGLPSISDATGNRRPDLGEREARIFRPADIGRIAVERDTFGAQAPNNGEGLRELQPVLERQRFVVDARGLLLGREQAVVAAIGIDQRNGIAWKVCRARPDEIEIA